MYEIPIAIFPFRRPELTQKLFRIISDIKPKRLLVNIDGPKTEKDYELIQKTVQIFEKIHWDCDLNLVTHEKNEGLGESYVNKIRWVFDHVDKAVFLEEDVLPDESFFKYMEVLLTQYEHDSNIAHISGANLMGRSPQPSSYFFSKFSLPHWGWASWARTIDNIDFSISDWEAGIIPYLKSFSVDMPFWEHIFEIAIKRKEIWDFPWMAAIWRSDSYVLVPTTNLVKNIGHGETATFTREKSRYMEMPTSSMSFPMKHPIGWNLSLAQRHESEIISWIKGISSNIIER